MKKTKLIIILLSLGLKGMTQTNNLIVFDQQGEPFTAILNGVQQNATPQTNVKVTGLNANTYKLRLIFQDQNIPPIDKTVFYNEMGNEETMNVVIKKDGEHVLRYVSMVPLAQAAPADPNQTVIVYGAAPPPPAQPMGGNTTTVTQQTTTTPDGGAVTMNMGGMNVGMNVTGMNGMATQQTTVTTTTTTSSGDMGAYNNAQQAPPPPPTYQQAPPPAYVDGYNGPIGCPMPMTHGDYESAKSSIAAKDFENTKMDMAKQIVGSNCLTAEQVRGIMKLFTFENTKLDFAKFAYSHTYDKANYFKVNDAFQFDNSSTELSNYISAH